MISEETKDYYSLKKRNDVRESVKRLRGQYLRYKDAEIVYSIQHKKLLEMASKAGAIYRIDSTVLINRKKNIFFVSQNEFGVKLLRMLTTPDWKERILESLFEDENRSLGRGTFTYDAYTNGTFEFSFLDGDISRLFRFREAILDRDGKFQIICYPEQVPFLKEYFGDIFQLSKVEMRDVEVVLGTKSPGVL